MLHLDNANPFSATKNEAILLNIVAESESRTISLPPLSMSKYFTTSTNCPSSKALPQKLIHLCQSHKLCQSFFFDGLLNAALEDKAAYIVQGPAEQYGNYMFGFSRTSNQGGPSGDARMKPSWKSHSIKPKSLYFPISSFPFTSPPELPQILTLRSRKTLQCIWAGIFIRILTEPLSDLFHQVVPNTVPSFYLQCYLNIHPSRN